MARLESLEDDEAFCSGAIWETLSGIQVDTVGNGPEGITLSQWASEVELKSTSWMSALAEEAWKIDKNKKKIIQKKQLMFKLYVEKLPY